MLKEFREIFNLLLEMYDNFELTTSIDLLLSYNYKKKFELLKSYFNAIDWKYYDIRETEKWTHPGWVGFGAFIYLFGLLFIVPIYRKYFPKEVPKKFYFWQRREERLEFTMGDSSWLVGFQLFEHAEVEDVLLHYGSAKPYLKSVHKKCNLYGGRFGARYTYYTNDLLFRRRLKRTLKKLRLVYKRFRLRKKRKKCI